MVQIIICVCVIHMTYMRCTTTKRIGNVETEQSLKGAANLTSLVTLNLIQQQEVLDTYMGTFSSSYQNAFCYTVKADRLLRIYALDTQNLVTVSTARSKSSSTVSYILQVWNIASIQVSIDTNQIQYLYTYSLFHRRK